MRLLALDVSTKTGWAVFDGSALIAYGGLAIQRLPEQCNAAYPQNYIIAARQYAQEVEKLIPQYKPDTVVIEETTPGRENYSQKLLLFLHYGIVERLMVHDVRLCYVQTGVWRYTVGLRMSPADRKGNLKKNLTKAKQQAKQIRGQIKALGNKKANQTKVLELKQQLALLQIGKITKKHLSVAKANELFNLPLILKHNDMADAMLLGWAYIHGAAVCDGRRPKAKDK